MAIKIGTIMRREKRKIGTRRFKKRERLSLIVCIFEGRYFNYPIYLIYKIHAKF